MGGKKGRAYAYPQQGYPPQGYPQGYYGQGAPVYQQRPRRQSGGFLRGCLAMLCCCCLVDECCCDPTMLIG